MDFEKFENVLYEAHTLCSEIPPKEKTFMEISGYPHLENVVSNIIIFYLNPNEEHDLNDIVLKSLLQVFKNKTNYDYNELDFSTISTFREYMTLKGNRIDIVLQSNEIVIGIENKIQAGVYNDLEDYATTLEKLNKRNLKILLSLKDETEIAEQAKFTNILYSEFFEILKNKLKNYKNKKNKWYVYLIDFIKNMEGYKMEKYMESKIYNWIKNNKDGINDFLKIIEISKKSIQEKAREYSSLFEDKLSNQNKIKFWNGEDLSTTCYAFFDIGCNLDVKLDIDGWKIGIFVWKKAHQLKIKEMLNQSGFSFDEENNHLWLFEYDYNCDTQIIVEKTEKIYKLLENIE